MAEEPSRPKLRLTERPPAPSPLPAAPPPTPERVFRAPALPVPEPPAVRLPPPPPPAPGPGRPTLRGAERPPPPPAPPAVPPAARASLAPLLGALACVVGAALLYTQVLRPRRAAREAAAAAAASTPPANAALPGPPPGAPGPAVDLPAVLERADPGASPEFRARVLALRLSGVFEGEPARAMIDGRLMRAGEVIDERLGLRFDGLEPGRRLRFRDAAGATVVRKY